MKLYKIFLFGFFVLSSVLSFGQDTPVDTTEKKIIHIVYSEMGEGVNENDVLKKMLFGDVILRQDSMYMYCDTAILIENNIDAIGHIIMTQGDSLNIWSDSLTYLGDEQIAFLKDSVVLKHKNNYLYTDALTFDVKNNIAKYETFSRLTNDTVYVMSKRGIYDLNIERAHLRDSVFVDGEQFFIKADSMDYDVKNKVVEFISKTIILQDSSKIFCEEGYYQINERNAYFTQNAQFQKGDIKSFADEIFYYGEEKKYVLIGDAHYYDDKMAASADTIIYNDVEKVYYLNGNAQFKDSTRQVDAVNIIYNSIDKSYETNGSTIINDGANILTADAVNFDSGSSLGLAEGNVIWLDTVQNITLHSDKILFDKDEHYYQSFGETRPWLEWIQKKDTMYISADTILTEGEGNKYMKAFNNVKILGSQISGLCDSLVFAKEDSLIHLFDDPILWIDSTQMTGDTIILLMANGKIDSLRLIQNAFIIDKLAENLYDQINGKYIDAKLEEGKIDKMFVNRNAQAIYYIRDDDKKFIGVNKSICSKMVFTMGEDKLKSVLFLVSPEFEMIPMKEIINSPIQLKGFEWRFDEKPLTLDEIK